MRTFNGLRGVAVAACVAVGLIAVMASSAAAGPKLYLKAEGKVLPTGTELTSVTIFAVPFFGACSTVEEGVLAVNQKSTDRITLEHINFRGCGPGSMSQLTGNTLGWLVLDWTGYAKFTKLMTPRLTLEEVGPCSYRVSGLRGLFEIPGEATFGAPASGWLQRSVSNVGCQQLQSIPFHSNLFSGPPEEDHPVETELRG